MLADDLQDVADIMGGSAIARIGLRATHVIRTAAAHSAAALAISGSRRWLATVARAERVRLMGVLILTATGTQSLLLQFAAPVVRPAVPGLLKADIVLVGLFLVFLAPAIGRAWGVSRIRRLLLAWIAPS